MIKMKRKVIFTILMAVMTAIALSGCVAHANSGRMTEPPFGNDLDDLPSTVYDRFDFGPTVELLTRYLHMQGRDVDIDAMTRCLQLNKRSDAVGLYLAAKRGIGGGEGVIFSQASDFRALPKPCLVTSGYDWIILAAYDGHDAFYYSGSNEDLQVLDNLTFDTLYMQGDMGCIFVTPAS